MASAILMVALVSSRIFWIRQPSLPMTFPICRDGTTILNSTSWANFTLRFAADSSSAETSSSSRRRFPAPADGCPYSNSGNAAVGTGRGMGMGKGRGAGTGMGTETGTVGWYIIGFIGFMGNWPGWAIVVRILEREREGETAERKRERKCEEAFYSLRDWRNSKTLFCGGVNLPLCPRFISSHTNCVLSLPSFYNFLFIFVSAENRICLCCWLVLESIC